MLSVPSFLSQSTPSLTISETDSLYMAVTTLHHELKSYAPVTCSQFDGHRDMCGAVWKALCPTTGSTEAPAVRDKCQVSGATDNLEKLSLVTSEITETPLPHQEPAAANQPTEEGKVSEVTSIQGIKGPGVGGREGGRAENDTQTASSNTVERNGFQHQGRASENQVAFQPSVDSEPENRTETTDTATNTIQQNQTPEELSPNSQMLSLPTATTAKSKGEFHKREESFSSSTHSNDSVFTDTDLSSSLQTSGRFVPGELSAEQSLTMGTSHGKEYTDGGRLNTALYRIPASDVQGKEMEDKCSPKDSGYGSRLNTDDQQSPLHSSPDKSSPRSLPSEAKAEDSPPGNIVSDSDDAAMKILTLANSPVLVNKSYLQFYYLDDSSLSAEELTSPDSVRSRADKRAETPTRGKYPKEPIFPRNKPSNITHNQLTIKSIKAIKSASCSSLDRLSLTSSLEDYASNLARGASGEDSVDGNDGFERGRLLSVTRFETLTGNLETLQCATIVRVQGPPSPSCPTSAQKEKRHKKHLLSRFHIGRRKTKAEVVKSGETSDQLKGVVVTQAGEVRLRKKNRSHGRQRMVVSDDLTHKVKFVVGKGANEEQSVEVRDNIQQTATPSTGTITKKVTVGKSKKKVLDKEPDRARERELCLSAEHASLRAGTYLVQGNHIGPFSAELSQSLDGGLADLKHLEIQLRKLALPSQSTTDLDLSQRVLEMGATLGLRVSHSVDDLSDPMGVSLSQTREASSDEPPRDGFLWRVLGRASQRWPALIHIVPIQTSQSGLRGFGVRKGQQVRALYRVSSQVIVETETNHMACIPYECCRISRKFYGPDSQLVQLSYTQLYVPVPDLPASIGRHPSSSSSPTSASPARHLHIHTPIEMVAIQDNYDRLPLGEINIDAGDKLRVLYCDEKIVYAVKENGQAGLLARNFCRLTRKSEKMYQKWVELTRSPFQADHPVKFGEKAPHFLFDGTLGELKEIRSKPTTPEAQRKLRVTSTQGDAQNRKSRDSASSVHSSSKTGLQKPLPPTPQSKRREKTPVSPLTQNDLRSPLSPVRQLSGLVQRTNSPITVAPPPSSPLPKSPIQRTAPTAPQKSNSTRSMEETPFARHRPAQRRADQHQPFSYAGKLMTVVRNYIPQVDGEESAIRKGLRVRVVNSSPDGRTLRVATKTGTQFDIPVGHLCMSRKNSEPSPLGHEMDNFNRSHEITFVPNGSIHLGSPQNTSPSQSLKRQLLMSPPVQNLPLECGKIMTVIRSFVPSPGDPMVTIRRGLRVKVLGGQDDQVKVVTKTGTTFSIPRGHLRLSHKTSDASAFAAADTLAKSPPSSPPSQRTSLHSPELNGADEDEQVETALNAHKSPPHSSPSVKKHVCASSSCNGSRPSRPPSYSGSPGNRVSGRASSVGEGGLSSQADLSRRGCRVNSTGSQVFELC